MLGESSSVRGCLHWLGCVIGMFIPTALAVLPEGEPDTHSSIPKCLGTPLSSKVVVMPWPQGPLEPRQAAGLPSCLIWTGQALSLGRARWERTSCPKATSLLCCWGQGLGMGMCWGLAAFLVWKENTPFPGMLFVSHGQTQALPVGLRGAKPCTCAHSVTVPLKCPLSWSWQFPGCVHSSLLSVPILPPWIRAGGQDTGQGSRFERQQGAAPGFLAAQFCSSGSFRASGMPGGDGGGVTVVMTELLSSANLGRAVRSAIDLGSLRWQVACPDPDSPRSRPLICLFRRTWVVTMSNRAVKSNSGCASPQDYLESFSTWFGPWGIEMLQLSVVPAGAALNAQRLFKLDFQAPVGFSA